MQYACNMLAFFLFHTQNKIGRCNHNQIKRNNQNNIKLCGKENTNNRTQLSSTDSNGRSLIIQNTTRQKCMFFIQPCLNSPVLFGIYFEVTLQALI